MIKASKKYVERYENQFILLLQNDKNKRKNMQKEAREGKRTLLKKDPGLPNLRVLKAKLDNKVSYSIDKG